MQLFSFLGGAQGFSQLHSDDGTAVTELLCQADLEFLTEIASIRPSARGLCTASLIIRQDLQRTRGTTIHEGYPRLQVGTAHLVLEAARPRPDESAQAAVGPTANGPRSRWWESGCHAQEDLLRLRGAAHGW